MFQRLGVEPGKFFLVTMHREENVDVESRLQSLVRALGMIQEEYQMRIICSIHPRTRKRMDQYAVVGENEQIEFHQPFGFFDFIALERSAFCVLSDSGTVQEECSIFKVANVTIRDVTERPETLECGSNILSGVEPESILSCIKTVIDQKLDWTAPPEYMVPNVSNTVAKIVLGYRHRL